MTISIVPVGNRRRMEVIRRMTKPKPPSIRVVGTESTANVTVNHRTWNNYLVYVTNKPQQTCSLGSLLTEQYGIPQDFEIILIPSDNTKLINRPVKTPKPKMKRGRKPKNDLRQRTEN